VQNSTLGGRGVSWRGVYNAGDGAFRRRGAAGEGGSLNTGRVRFFRSLVVAGTVVLLLPAPATSRPQRSVFSSQSVEWEADGRRRERPATLVFSRVWTFNGFRAPLAGDPLASGRSLFVSSQDGEVVALEQDGGTETWRVSLGEPLALGPAWGPGVVFVTARSGKIRALEMQDGRTTWTTDLRSEPAFLPRLVEGRLLVATAAGLLFALDARDGSVVSRRALPGRPVTPLERAPGSLLIGTEGGILLAIGEVSLETRWRRDLGNAITSPPVFMDGRVYVALSDRSIRCLRFRSGRQRWKARTGAIITARPFVRAPYLYVPCYDNDIWVLHSRSGHLVSRARLGHRLDSNPAVTEHHLFVVPSTEAALVGLTLPELQTAGQYPLNIPGEAFTTAPVLASERIALGYGRNEGKILALAVADVPKPAPGSPPATTRKVGSP
jgi:outer membrane protein assembly factor BamB